MNSESPPRSQGESVCPIVIARETHLTGEKELPTRSVQCEARLLAVSC